jgi:DNA-binding XRE family transcriptional regulator
MPNNKPSYATNITFLRRRLNMTRKQAAHIANVNVKSWDSWEEGRAFPRWAKIPGVCKALRFNDVVKLITNDLTKEEE